MRVAVQISGAPRFCRDFDLFLEKLKNYSNVDWFFYLWKENPFPEVNNRELVADSWRSIPNVEWATSKIQENLPGGHTIRILELADQTVYANSEKIQRVIEAHADSMWKMFQGFYQVNQLRINYEQGHDPYDLVIRARNDAGIIGNFNLEEIYGRCSNNNNAVIISDNHRHGHRSLKLNDIFAVSLPKNITIYCDLVNNIVKYNVVSKTTSSLGFKTSNGVNGVVHTILVSGSNLYVGGDFTTVDGNTNGSRIAKWNTITNTWSTCSAGVDGSVYSIVANSTGVLFAGTSFGISISSDNGSTWRDRKSTRLNSSHRT